jgi:hypothetical protein
MVVKDPSSSAASAIVPAVLAVMQHDGQDRRQAVGVLIVST